MRIATLITFLCSPFVVALASPGQTLPEPPHLTSWSAALSDASAQFNIKFTIEFDEGDGTVPSKIPTLISPFPKVATLDELKKLIQSAAPAAEIIESADHKVLHIVDRALVVDKSYILNVHASMQFRGTLNEMFGTLQKQSLSQIKQNNRSNLTEPLVTNHQPVSVDVHNVAYRDLLSAIQIPENTSSVEWTIEVQKTDEHNIAYVRFGQIVAGDPSDSK